MLAIQPTSSKKCTPNLLPMRINHNGRIENTSRYWTPTSDEKGTNHAYFRGRHLHGTTLPLPPTHTGAVLNITDRIAPQPSASSNCTATPHGPLDDEDDDDEMEQETPEEVKIAEQIGEFEEIVVWGHGGVVEEGDEFVRGVREWVGFAGVMHCDEEDEDTAVEKSGMGEGEKMTTT